VFAAEVNNEATLGIHPLRRWSKARDSLLDPTAALASYGAFSALPCGVF
jgi:hypothetical protein